MADIYQAKDFEDWWAHHYKGAEFSEEAYKSKPGEMNDYDWQVGQKLYNLYQQGQKYQEDYDNAANASAQRATDARIAADVSRQRLEKYLPQQLALQGLYGTGMSEDAYLKLQNQYQGAVSDANKQHEANLAAYKSTLDAQKLALGTQAGDAVDKIIDRKREDDIAIEEAQYRKFTEASDYLINGYFPETTDVDNYISKFEGGVVSEAQLTALRGLGNEAKSGVTARKAQETEAAKVAAETANLKYRLDATVYDSLTNGDDITVKVGDRELVVESNGKAAAGITNYAAENSIKAGQLFVKDGKPYIYDGKNAYNIVSKGGEYYNAAYNDVMCYLLYGSENGGNVDNYKNVFEKTWDKLMKAH